MSLRSYYHGRIQDSTFEINLAPMLDILTVLITVLLVSFQSVRLGLLDGLIPQPVLNALEQDRKKTDRQLQIAVKMNPKTGFVIDVTETGKKPTKIDIPNIAGKMDLVRLHSELISLKLLKTDNFRMELNPTEEASYEEIIQVMDRARTTATGDKKIQIKDEKTGKMVDTNLVFPDIVFSNAVEG
jgi:biopolymer transport protein ExbD